MELLERLLRWLYVLSRGCINSSWTPLVDDMDTNKETKQTLGESLRRKIYCTENCDLHDVLQEEEPKKGWPERQLKIDESHRIIEITERFNKTLKKLELTSSIADYIRIIDETCFQFMSTDPTWNRVREILKTARQEDNPELVIKAYTCEQKITQCLNNHLAANAHHFLKLYCTIQNCPILSRTQEYTEAFSVILTHPKLRQYHVKNKILYRGAILPDKKLIESYQEGNTILTTTLLSTSTNKSVARFYCAGTTDENSLPVLWIYDIGDMDRPSALDIGALSQFNDEEEVLLLRYVPFKIISIKPDVDGIINIHLAQCSERVTESNQSTDNNNISLQLNNSQCVLEPNSFDHTHFGAYSSCSVNDEVVLTMT